MKTLFIIKEEFAIEIVSEASVILKGEYPSIVPSILDHQIWNNMSFKARIKGVFNE